MGFAIPSFLLLQKQLSFGVGAMGNHNSIYGHSFNAFRIPHNLILEVACEYGLHTALLLLLLFLYVFHLGYHKMIQYNRDKTSLYPLLFYLFLYFLLLFNR